MSNYNHITDFIPMFESLFQKIEELRREQLSNIDYESQDARMVALDFIQQNLLSQKVCIVSIDLLAKNLNNKEAFLSRFDLDPKKNIDDLNTAIYNPLRLGFIILIHFQIENLFANILNTIEPNNKTKGFWNLKQKISEQTGIIDMSCFVAFSCIRNSLHNNGIYKGNDFDYGEFIFKKNQKVECAGWHHVLQLLDEIIDKLEDVLLSENIKNIVEIKDDFAYLENS